MSKDSLKKIDQEPPKSTFLPEAFPHLIIWGLSGTHPETLSDSIPWAMGSPWDLPVSLGILFMKPFEPFSVCSQTSMVPEGCHHSKLLGIELW